MSFPPPPHGTVREISTMYWLSRCLHVVTTNLRAPCSILYTEGLAKRAALATTEADG